MKNSKTTKTTQTTDRKDTRLPIDAAQRIQNRALATPQVLTLLAQQLPDVFGIAEVVGGKPDSGWVWVQFESTPAAEIRQQLAQLGFHWNSHRQAWQHPCGQHSLSSASDPRERYHSYFPADAKAA